MSLFRRSIHEGDHVRCHVKNHHVDYWTTGIVTDIYPDYYLPDWFKHPNMKVEFDFPKPDYKSEIFTRSEVRLIKRKEKRDESRNNTCSNLQCC